MQHTATLLAFSGRRGFRTKSHVASNEVKEKTQSEIGSSSLRLMNDRNVAIDGSGMRHLNHGFLKQFSTPGMKKSR